MTSLYYYWTQISLTILQILIVCVCDSSKDNILGKLITLDHNIEIVYQVPSEKAIHGVLVLFHGCSHSATDFFQSSAECKKCRGLPVEIAVVKAAANEGFFVVSISSSNRDHKCWLPREDIIPVTKGIKHVYEEVLGAKTKIPIMTSSQPSFSKASLSSKNIDYSSKHMDPPLFILGASSGGSFAGMYAQDAKLLNVFVSALCVQVCVSSLIILHISIPITLLPLSD